MDLGDSLFFVIFAISYCLAIIFAAKYEGECKRLKEENSRLKIELLQQVNENLRLKNNISTDTVE